jgi:predicted metal-dependent peptidase
MRHSPFLSYLLQSVTVVETEKIPTMAVTEMGHLLYNPKFVEALLKSETGGVLVHEVLHLSLKSFPRRRGRDNELWNIASDLPINYFVNYNTVDELEVPEELDMRDVLPDEKKEQIPEEADTTSKFYVPDKDGSFTYKGEVKLNVTEMNAEEIYDRIKNFEDEQEGEDGDEGEGEGEGGGGIFDDLSNGNSPTDGSFDDMYSEDEIVVSDSDEAGKKTIELPDGAEIDVPEESLDEQDWDEINASAQQHANRRGNVPAGLEDVLKPSQQNKIDWKKYIHQVVRENIPSGYKWDRPSAATMGNPNIPYLPGRDKNEKLSVIVAVDTSGSVSDELLRIFLGEVAGIVSQNSQCDLVLLFHDAEVQKVEEYSSPSRNEFDQVEIAGRGGTNHVPVFEYIQENYMSGNYRTDPTVVINLTDGRTQTPEIPDWPKFDQCLWVLNDHQIGMDRLKKGEIIRIEPDEY